MLHRRCFYFEENTPSKVNSGSGWLVGSQSTFSAFGDSPRLLLKFLLVCSWLVFALTARNPKASYSSYMFAESYVSYVFGARSAPRMITSHLSVLLIHSCYMEPFNTVSTDLRSIHNHQSSSKYEVLLILQYYVYDEHLMVLLILKNFGQLADQGTAPLS